MFNSRWIEKHCGICIKYNTIQQFFKKNILLGRSWQWHAWWKAQRISNWYKAVKGQPSFWEQDPINSYWELTGVGELDAKGYRNMMKRLWAGQWWHMPYKSDGHHVPMRAQVVLTQDSWISYLLPIPHYSQSVFLTLAVRHNSGNFDPPEPTGDRASPSWAACEFLFPFVPTEAWGWSEVTGWLLLPSRGSWVGGYSFA